MFVSICGTKLNSEEDRLQAGKIGDEGVEEVFRMCGITFIITVRDQSNKNYVDIKDEAIVDVHRISTKAFERVDLSKGVAALSQGVKNPGRKFSGKAHVILTEIDISRSLEYFYRIEKKLVRQFNKPDFLKKIFVELIHVESQVQ